MSIYHPDHDYSVTIFDNQDRMAKTQFVAVNCVKRIIELGVKTTVPGKYLMALETKGSYIPTQVRDERTGQERAVRQQWMPRFQIQVHEDVSVSGGLKNLPPIPAGAVLLDRPEPVKTDFLADARKAILTSESEERVLAEDAEPDEDAVVPGPYDNKLMPELRALCSKKGIKLSPKNTREDLIQMLTESDREAPGGEG